jgi:hypothetical protein
MKKALLLLAVAMLTLTVSCKKEKNCRCAAMGTQNVQIITITNGDCHKILYSSYLDVLDVVHLDTLVCTDFPFEADSTIRYAK